MMARSKRPVNRLFLAAALTVARRRETRQVESCESSYSGPLLRFMGDRLRPGVKVVKIDLWGVSNAWYRVMDKAQVAGWGASLAVEAQRRLKQLDWFLLEVQ